MGSAQRTASTPRRTPPAAFRVVTGLVVLALTGLAGCGPGTGGDAKHPAPAAGGTGASASSTPTAGAGMRSTARPGSRHTGAPRSSVGPDGVTSWNPDDLGRAHVTTTVHYPTKPPVGGDHAPIWMNCDGDVYTEQVPDMNAVHSLEHGAVWVTYTAEAAPADVRELAALVRRTPYTLMSPYPGQPHPIMLTAWGKQRAVGGAADPAVNAFFAAYVQGRQTPEPGAPCTGGLRR